MRCHSSQKGSIEALKRRIPHCAVGLKARAHHTLVFAPRVRGGWGVGIPAALWGLVYPTGARGMGRSHRELLVKPEREVR